MRTHKASGCNSVRALVGAADAQGQFGLPALSPSEEMEVVHSKLDSGTIWHTFTLRRRSHRRLDFDSSLFLRKDLSQFFMV